MTLLIDGIKNIVDEFHPSTSLSKAPEKFKTIVNNSMEFVLNEEFPCFEITNVDRYVSAHVPDGENIYDHIPVAIAFPSDHFWMEYTEPWDERVRTGAFIWVVRSEETGVWSGNLVYYSNLGQIICDPLRTGVLGPSAPIIFQVDGTGALVPGSIGTLWECDSEVTDLVHVYHNVIVALTFLNCKNVTVTDNEGKHASRQERRAAERRNDPPLVTYKTLQIEPMKKVLATEGDIAKNGLAKALHICRGHFAEYGGESGKGKLFGKYEGRFYIPAHVRGSAEKGVVHKRYNVNAPKDDAA